MTDTAGELSERLREFVRQLPVKLYPYNPEAKLKTLAIEAADEIDRLRSARTADADVIERARAEERERCANVAEAFPVYEIEGSAREKSFRGRLVAAIRALGKE
ncbi:MAG TPA: hypothetical protein VFX37_09880 [Pseudolabrys sp.]|nr:hypothetical protein [Pseudolabrys sp.]